MIRSQMASRATLVLAYEPRMCTFLGGGTKFSPLWNSSARRKPPAHLPTPDCPQSSIKHVLVRQHNSGSCYVLDGESGFAVLASDASNGPTQMISTQHFHCRHTEQNPHETGG
jgi:hypothetical protein